MKRLIPLLIVGFLGWQGYMHYQRQRKNGVRSCFLHRSAGEMPGDNSDLIWR
jgi:hypothetical protein